MAAHCPGSFALAHDDHENPAAEKGTAIHSFIEAVLADGIYEPEKVENPSAREVCEGLDPSQLIDVAGARMGNLGDLGELHIEVPLAYHPATGEAVALDSEGHRDYSAAPKGSVCGTADAVALWEEEDGRYLLVTDWKTGSRLVDPPYRNLQLAFLALSASRVFGQKTDSKPDGTADGMPDGMQEHVIAQIAYVDGSGAITVTAHEFSKEDIQSAEAKLRALAQSVERSRGGEPRLVVGAHCRFCPAFARCPAQAGAAQALLEDKDDSLSDAKVGEAWERLQAVEAATKKVRAALTDYVASAAPDGGVKLPQGSVLKIVESRREKIDPALAMPVLRAAYGEEADAAVTISKTGLKKLAGDSLSRCMAALEESDAVEVSHSESLREVGNRG